MTLFSLDSTASARGTLGRLRRAAKLGCGRLISGAILAALLSFPGQSALAQDVTSGTTIYLRHRPVGHDLAGGHALRRGDTTAR